MIKYRKPSGAQPSDYFGSASKLNNDGNENAEVTLSESESPIPSPSERPCSVEAAGCPSPKWGVAGGCWGKGNNAARLSEKPEASREVRNLEESAERKTSSTCEALLPRRGSVSTHYCIMKLKRFMSRLVRDARWALFCSVPVGPLRDV
eukprot:EG_transcript_7913